MTKASLCWYQILSNIKYKSHQIAKHKFLVSSCSCLCTIYWSQMLSQEWRCSSSKAWTTSEWSTSLLPTKLHLILEVWHNFINCLYHHWINRGIGLAPVWHQYIGSTELGHHWSRYWLDVTLTSSHYLSQWWPMRFTDLPTPDPAQTIRFMIWNHTISLQTIQFSDQTIQFYSKPYNCLSNHL